MRSGRLRLLLTFGSLVRRKDRVKDGPFHARHELDHGYIANILNEAIDDVVSEVTMGHLAASESQTRFDFVAALQELDCLILLGLIVVVVDRYGEFDFLDGDDFLLLSGGAFGFFLLVQITAVVLDAADRRDGVGRDFDEVEAALTGDAERFKGSQDTELFAVFVDYADFAGANAIVDADERLGRAFVDCDGTSSKGVGRPDPEDVPEFL